VSYGGTYTKIGQQFLEIAGKYDLEHGQTDDSNDFSTCNAYAVSPRVTNLFVLSCQLSTEVAKVRTTVAIFAMTWPYVA
jgi:hypothetical protein